MMFSSTLMILWWAGAVQAPPPSAPVGPEWRVMQLAQDAELRYLRVAPTLDDYPKVARRIGAEGTSLVRLKIDPSGQILECTTARTSGWKILDEGACALYRTHGRFELRSSKPVSVVAPVTWKLLD